MRRNNLSRARFGTGQGRARRRKMRKLIYKIDVILIAKRSGSRPRINSGGVQICLVLNAGTMQVVAMGIEPVLGALDMAADPAADPPEPRRVIHLDEMRDLMGGQIVQHVGRREDQPPGKRQRSGRGA